MTGPQRLRHAPRIGMTLRTIFMIAYVAIAGLSLTGVLFRGAATAEGLTFGLPAGLAWVTGWSVATFFALWIYDATRPLDPESGEEA